MWEWANANAGVLGLIFAALPVAWAVWRYLALKRQEMKSRRFRTYHKLVQQLVEPEDKDRTIKLDRQLAVVFELRRFPEYYEPTLRILEGLRNSWGQQHKDELHNRLFEEMDATIRYIRKRNRCVYRAWRIVRGL
jgi:hypothetical protein